MNIINKLFAACLLTVMLSSCSREWLDQKPLSINSPENIFVDKNGMESILLKLRKDLRGDFYGGNPSALAIEMISSEIGVAGEQLQDMVINHDLYSTPTNVGTWPQYRNWDLAWSPIRDANIVIARINVPVWSSEEDKNAILGEAYFHRAYWYYRLVHQFGDVPFLNEEFSSPVLNFQSHSRTTILKKIQADLEQATTWLPEITLPGKVNRAAGLHLLAKVCLANHEYDKAITAASQVINDGKYKLMTQRFGSVASNSRFNVIWDLHQKANKSAASNTEALLVVQDKYGFPDAQTAGTQTMRVYSPWWCSALLKDANGLRACVDPDWDPQIIGRGRGVGMFRPSNYLNYTIWENCGADLRHDADTNWMPTSKIYVNNPASAYYGQPIDFKYSNQIDSIRAFFPWPQYKVYVADELRPQKPTGGNSDWYVFRLAETYLLRAEAYYWKGIPGSAADDVNAVRRRAHAPEISAGDITIDYILDERARELYLEEPRKTELTRIAFMMAEKNLNGYSVENFTQKNFWFDRVVSRNTFYNKNIVWNQQEFKISPYHVLWPIPQSVIDANTGGRINQNKGYYGAEKNIAPLTEIK